MLSYSTKAKPRVLKNKPIPEKLMRGESGEALLTAIEYLLARPQYEKDLDDDYSDDETNVNRALAATASLLKSKDYSHKTIKKLIDDNSLNALIQNLLIKGIHESINTGDHNGSVDMMKAYFKLSLDFHGMGCDEFLRLGDKVFKPYQGTSEEHKKIIQAIVKSKKLDPDFEEEFEERQTAGYGTARIFQRGVPKAMRGLLNYTTDKEFLKTKIVILGAGPAGILTARTLAEIGFSNIQILDQSGKFNGIWKINSVSKGTINNPFNINFLGIKLPASTGRKGSGAKLIRFLDQVILGKKDMKGRRLKNYFWSKMPELIKAKIISIKAGNLEHEIKYLDKDLKEQLIKAPIVINAIGLGQPTDLSAKDAPMKTSTPKLCGSRWQLKISPELATKLNGKNITIVGLGNSSIEMLMQIQDCNRKGFNIGYKVLTHYPKESVENPDQYIKLEGKEYRVFRDLNKSNLVDLEGDIPAARNAYRKALEDGNIISDVIEWNRSLEDKVTNIKLRNGKEISIPTDQQLTLTGYRPSKEMFQEMNINLDEDNCPLYDYDGEVQRPKEEKSLGRTYKGYSIIGAIRANDNEPNALVIPGIMDSLPKLVFNTILRTIDFTNSSQSS
jgi:hypothetical protein